MTFVQIAAGLAAAGCLAIAVFQFALAAGAPLGRAAWGGQYERLPVRLRISSAIAVIVWLGGALVVLDRGGFGVAGLPDQVAAWGTWALAAVLGIGALLNFASSSPYERFGWGPLAIVTAVFVVIVALG